MAYYIKSSDFAGLVIAVVAKQDAYDNRKWHPEDIATMYSMAVDAVEAVLSELPNGAVEME